MASDENSVCADHSGNGGSLLSTYDQLETCIDWLSGCWLVDTNVIDETVLAASNLTSKTAASGGDSTGTISIVRALIVDAFDFLTNPGPQDILATGANGSQTATTGFSSA